LRHRHPSGVRRNDPFRIIISPTASFYCRAALLAARPFLSWMLALRPYRALYRRACTSSTSAFCIRALRTLDIEIDLAAGSASSVPPAGPLIVVANHPHGIVDGLALADVVSRRRPDVRVLTNHRLAQIPDLEDLCLFVDVSRGRDSAARSLAGLRGALRWLKDGHVLVVFPAGSVAHGAWQTTATPVDSDWQDTVGRLALQSSATVVPAFIAGRNRRWFYRVGQLHHSLRTLLLARELLALRGGRIEIRLGRPMLLASGDGSARDGTQVTALMRVAVDRLAHSHAISASRTDLMTIDASDPAALGREVQRLTDQRLLESGRFEVFCAPASRIPSVLEEIGRLRELTFRGVGEGTGHALDLDRFDEHYLHLFVWNADAREIVGAYRIGCVDRILASHGIEGLYTSTLFRYDHRLLSRLGPAIELGRSFVRAEYQRSSNALLLLWRGIAQFVAQSRRYRVLFGPVSISSRYTDMSQHLLRAFLAQNARHRELADLVEAVNKPMDLRLSSGFEGWSAGDLQSLDRLIASREPDGKGIPVLLRQYLRLNAKLLGFSVDAAFGDALDALMMVDLAEVDRVMLNRYFGSQEAARLVSFRSEPRDAAA
jgi:putative hemolysin